MRLLFLGLLSFPLLASTLTLPVPVTGETAVSIPVLGPAAGDQGMPQVASNGEVALAAWQDRRSGGYDIYATRIDRNGRVLDPTGIRVTSDAALDAVIWNGTSFVVATHFNLLSHTLTFVSPDGVVIGRRGLGLAHGARFLDASQDGEGVHLLYVQQQVPGAARATIFNGEGDVTASLTLPVEENFRDLTIAAGSADGEFLLLRSLEHSQGTRPAFTAATRIGFDGRVLSHANSNLSVRFVDPNHAIEGGPGGYIVVTQSSVTPAASLFRLNAKGVFTGIDRQLVDPNPTDREMWGYYRPRIVREGDGYLVVWHLSRNDGHSFTYAANVSAEALPGPARQIWDWLGITNGAAVASFGGQRVAVVTARKLGAPDSDVFAHLLTPSLDAAPPVVLAETATAETAAEVAAGANGFLIAWRERDRDSVHRHFVRRVSAAGEPQEATREIYAGDFPAIVQLASNGGTYLVTWLGRDGLVGRRMSAATGEWRDAAPFLIAATPEFADEPQEFAVESNGRDAVVAWSGEHYVDPFIEWRLMARRVHLSGEPLREEPVLLAVTPENDPQDPHDLTLGTNGEDYLLAWSASFRSCAITCIAIPSFEIRALRLAADATKLDDAPLLLDPADEPSRYPVSPSVAWNGDRYLVAWSVAGTITGAVVTREGAIAERDITLARRLPGHSVSAKLIAHRDHFVLFTRYADASAAHAAMWQAVAFRATEDLDRAADLPRVTIARSDSDQFGFLDAVSNGNAIVTGYDRVSGANAGGVPRVFVRLFDLGEAKLRRRAVR